MQYFSTNNKNISVGFKQAVLQGIAEDGGLFMPQNVPKLPESFFKKLSEFPGIDLARQVLRPFASDIPEQHLSEILEKTITFEAPLVMLDRQLAILELFHGPTLAFKDFGARFLANTLQYILKGEAKETIILVATSGDTGSAVAHAFLGKQGIRVGLLYPSGKVSEIQEQQLTTIGQNVKAFEIDGTFDDCQRLVKQAFLDRHLNQKFNLTSANSINIARLLPQMIYYFWALAGLEDLPGESVFVVPSGNFGNLTAGLMAARMGLPVERFIAAVNSNRFFVEYLSTGKAQARKSVPTLSNAMDVGNPSNFDRIRSLFENQVKSLRSVISSYSVSDEETLAGIKEVYKKYKYVIDPHGAVGFRASQQDGGAGDTKYIVLETAHPAKFADTVERALDRKISIPERLAVCLTKQKQTIKCDHRFEDFKSLLLESF